MCLFYYALDSGVLSIVIGAFPKTRLVSGEALEKAV
jgi:hypothetical protein